MANESQLELAIGLSRLEAAVVVFVFQHALTVDYSEMFRENRPAIFSEWALRSQAERLLERLQHTLDTDRA